MNVDTVAKITNNITTMSADLKQYPILEQCVHCDKIYRGYTRSTATFARYKEHGPLETRCKSCWLDVKHYNPAFYAEVIARHALNPSDPPFHFPK